MTPEKRNQLIFLLLVTALAVAILHLAVVSSMQNSLATAKGALEEARGRKLRADRELLQAADLRQELEGFQESVKRFEATMPTRDVYDWLVKSLSQVVRKTGVVLFDVSRPVEIKDPPISPPAGYASVQTKIEVTGSYFELGSFVADLENTFPTLQFEDLVVGPLPTRKAGPGPADLLLTAQLLFLAPKSDIYALPKQ